MSAFFVSKADIDLLVSGLRELKVWIPWRGGYAYAQEADPAELGKMLWAENVKSLRARYPDMTAEHADEDAMVASYRFTEYHGLKLAPLGKIAACYDYQSGEHDGWKASAACAIVTRLREAIIERLPGYCAAPWGVSWAEDIAKVCTGERP